jgi:hypothetical protein
MLETMYSWRDEILGKAQLKPGDTLLDVGAGDGLIAFGALDRLGPSGHVTHPEAVHVGDVPPHVGKSPDPAARRSYEPGAHRRGIRRVHRGTQAAGRVGPRPGTIRACLPDRREELAARPAHRPLRAARRPARPAATPSRNTNQNKPKPQHRREPRQRGTTAHLCRHQRRRPAGRLRQRPRRPPGPGPGQTIRREPGGRADRRVGQRHPGPPPGPDLPGHRPRQRAV